MATDITTNAGGSSFEEQSSSSFAQHHYDQGQQLPPSYRILGEDDVTTLSSRQQLLLCITPILPSIISIISSYTIIRLVIRSKFDTPYNRILFMFSICVSTVLLIALEICVLTHCLYVSDPTSLYMNWQRWWCPAEWAARFSSLKTSRSQGCSPPGTSRSECSPGRNKRPWIEKNSNQHLNWNYIGYNT